MKYRSDFVTNSSSSSFICEVCGHVEDGYDSSPSDLGMAECEHGHAFCQDHLLTPSLTDICLYLQHFRKTTDIFDDLFWEKLEEQTGFSLDVKPYEVSEDLPIVFREMVEESGESFYDDVPSIYCPICQMEHIPNDKMVQYLLKKEGLTLESVQQEIKDTYGSFAEFIKDL